jgi:hypothetical protein
MGLPFGLLTVSWLALAALHPAFGQSLLSREDALREYFPPPQVVEKRTLFLTEDQVKAIESRARARVDSRLLTYYAARDSGRITGYAIVETRIVRTLPQTFMVVVSGDGTLRGVELLAFSEPEDYRPPERWLDTFTGRSLTDDLWLKRGVRNIIGATITAESITSGVREVLATVEATLLGGR